MLRAKIGTIVGVIASNFRKLAISGLAHEMHREAFTRSILLRSCKMNRLTILAVGSLLTITSSLTSSAEPEQKKDEPSVWMKQKLERSKDILEGMSTGNLDQIAKSAEALNILTKIEAFARGKTAGYRTQLQFFNEANDEIIRQANEENLEGVSLSFHQLTNSCVQCHKQLRKAKDR